MTDNEIIRSTVASDAFRVERAYLRRGGLSVAERPRLFKRIDGRFVRMIFPTDIREVDDGAPGPARERARLAHGHRVEVELPAVAAGHVSAPTSS